MSVEDNVVQMPILDPLMRHTIAINTAREKRDNGHYDWIEATLEISIELAKVKTLLPNTTEFGEWYDRSFGNFLNQNERAILIQWGKNPQWTKDVLLKTERLSIEMIHNHEWRLTSPRKSRTPSVGGDKTHAVHAALQANERAGVKATQKQMAEALGVSASTVGEATRDMKAAQAANIFTYTKAQDAQVEARVKVYNKIIEDEFSERVRVAAQKLYDENFPTLQKEQNEAFQEKMYYQKLLASHEHIFTKTEYFDILFCTMNKEVEESKKHRASQALIAKKFQLTGEK